MPVFPSEEWLAACREAINADEALTRAGRTWVGGIALHCMPEPGSRIGRELYGLLDLRHGLCHDARAVNPSEAHDADYLISAPYFTWKRIVSGELDPIFALTMRAVHVRGNLWRALRHAHAIRLLAKTVGRVPGTEFIDEIDEARVRALRDEGWPVGPDL